MLKTKINAGLCQTYASTVFGWTQNRYVRLRVSSKGMKIIDKKGIDEVLKDVRASGQKI